MKVNKNFENIGLSATLEINEKSNKLISEGKTIYKFGLGQSPFPVPEIVVKELINKSKEKDYLEVIGLKKLREVVAKYHSEKNNYKYLPENIIVGPGTKELLFQLQFILNYDLILPIPSWVSYGPQAKLLNKKIHYIKSSAEENWNINPLLLDECCANNPLAKLLIINSPNNPSGTRFNNYKKIGEVAKKYKLIVVSDEIYNELNYDGSYESITNYYPEGTIVSSGLSKWCGAGGWRIGTMSFPNELKKIFDAFRVMASETFTSVSAPIQYAAIKAYSENHDKYLLNSRKILKFISEFIYEEFSNVGIKCQKAQGGFYMLCDFSETKISKFNDSRTLCKTILEKTGFAMLPGTDFGFNENELITRIAFVDFDGEKALNFLESNVLDSKSLNKIFPNIDNGVRKLTNFIESFS